MIRRVFRCFILFALLGFASSAVAQDWSSLSKEVSALYDKGDYKAALPVAIKMVELAKNELGTKDLYYGKCIVWQATIYTALNDPAGAEKSYLEALEVYKVVPADSMQNYAATQLSLSDIYISQEKYDQAEDAIRAAEKVYKVNPGPATDAYATVLAKLRDLFETTKELKKSIAVYEDILQFFKVIGRTDSVYAANANILAIKYYTDKQYDQAEKYYLQAKAIFSKEKNMTADYANILGNLTILYTTKKDVKQQLAALEEIRLLQADVAGTNNADYARILSAIGQVHYNSGNYNAAEPLFMEAINVLKELDIKNASYIDILTRLGQIYKKLEIPARAKIIYTDIIAFYEPVTTENKFKYASALNSLAVQYIDTEEYEKAIPYLEKALAIWKDEPSTLDSYKIVLENLVTAYANLSKYEQAIIVNRKLIDLDAGTATAKTPEYAFLLKRMGVYYYNIDDLVNARQYYIKALDIFKSDTTQHQINYINTLNNMGLVYTTSGRYKQNIEVQQQILDIIAQQHGKDHPAYAAQLNALGTAWYNFEDYTRAEQFYQAAGNLYKKLRGMQSDEYLQTVGSRAGALGYLKKSEAATALFDEFISGTAKINGDTSLAYFKAISAKADFLYETDRYRSADTLYLKVLTHLRPDAHFKFYIKTLQSQAKNNVALANDSVAEQQYQQVLKLLKAKGDTSDYYYSSTFTRLGYIYKNTSRYALAKQYFGWAIEKSGEEKAGQTDVYTTALTGLATVLQLEAAYTQAEQYFLKLREIAVKRYGEQSVATAKCDNNLGLLYEEMGNNALALSYYKKALAVVQQQLGVRSNESTTELNNMAYVYRVMGDYATAEKLYLQALEIRKEVLGAHSANYASALNNLASLYQTMGLYPKAETAYLESLAINKELFGVESENYALLLSNMGSFYVVAAKYDKSLEYLQEALRIREKLFGRKSLSYAYTLSNLGSLYLTISKVAEAETVYKESLQIRREILGTKHYLYGETLNAFGEFYRQTNQFEKAIPYFEQAIAIYKETYGEKANLYATPIGNLGLNYSAMGKFNLAEPLLLQATAIWKLNGENTLDYALGLNNLAVLYSDIGQLEKAIKYYKQALELRKMLLGEDHPDYGETLSNAAIIYAQSGLFDDAERMYVKALDIARKSGGATTISYAIRINNLAGLYMAMKKLNEAEQYYKEALSCFEKILGPESAAYATALSNMGSLYFRTGQLDQAEAYFTKAMALRAKIFGTSNVDYSASLDELFRLNTRLGRYATAEKYLIETGKISIQNLTETFAVLSEKEKGNYIENNITLLHDFNSFIYLYPQASPQTLATAANLLLKLKSLTLTDTRHTLDAIKQSNDTTIVALYTRWMTDKATLAREYALPSAQQRADLKKVEDRAEATEKELTRRSTGFNKDQQSAQVTYRDVQRKLAPDEAAIEFVSFDLYRNKWTDTTIYAAYLLTGRDTIPKFIPLGTEAELKKLFDNAGKNATTMVNSFYRGLEAENTGNAVLGDSLYNMVWKPLEQYLQGIKRINYSPAGKLYAVAFNALPIGNKKLLIDKYTLQQYTSTRDIATRSAIPSVKPADIVFFGDATFTVTVTQHNESKQQNTTGILPQNRGGGGIWPELPGTLQEVNTIKKLFDANKISTRIFTKTAASEENLKALSGRSPRILHLATHGFFLPPADKKADSKEKNTYALADDPLVRSGLVLAGGNAAWAGNIPDAGMEDGIATAYEISQLDFNNTDLVVLSACETALGDVKGSEGVFGLQRGFKLAGVKKMIVSLWQVPDKETAELMTTFYTYTFQGKPVNEAFNLAQTAMRKKYSPYYWAAFVLIE